MKKRAKEVFKKYKFIFVPLIVIVVVELLFQIFYPSNAMLPIAFIDGVDVGGRERQEVVDELNEKYNNADVEIFFGANIRPTFVIKPADLGVQIGNAERVNSASYKWYLKLIPTSIFWAGLIPPSAEPTIKHDNVSVNNFVAQNLGDSCNVKPVNALPAIENGEFKIIKMLKGGTCQIFDVKKALSSIKYKADVNEVRVPMEEFDATITDDIARSFVTELGIKLQRDVLMSTENDEKFFIPKSEVMSWLEFSITNDELIVEINKSKSGKYYEEKIAPKVSTEAGVTMITTNNLTDLIRENGSEGKVLNVDETNRRLTEFLMDKRQSITLAFSTIYPNIEYSSRFEHNSTGLSAFIKYYAETRGGNYGIFINELGGQWRSASYNADQKFTVAGAARMILAFTMLDRHEQGIIVTDADVDSCLGNVLGTFTINCLYPSVLGNLETSIDRLGLRNTKVSGGNIISTANDLGQFLQRLQDRRLGLEYGNNQKIYDGLRSATPRNGISSSIGINNLNATGYVNGDLSDAAIVFTASTNYILVILTKNSSWRDIADLSSQIQGVMAR